jgi:hypothetical protein
VCGGVGSTDQLKATRWKLFVYVRSKPPPHTNRPSKLIFCPLTHCLQIAHMHMHVLGGLCTMKRSEWGLAAWRLGSWWCVFWIMHRNKLLLSNMTSSTRYNGSTGFGRYSPLGVRRCRRGGAGGASHLPMQMMPACISTHSNLCSLLWVLACSFVDSHVCTATLGNVGGWQLLTLTSEMESCMERGGFPVVDGM